MQKRLDKQVVQSSASARPPSVMSSAPLPAFRRGVRVRPRRPQINSGDGKVELPFVVYHLSPEGLAWFYGRVPWFVRLLIFPMLAKAHGPVRAPSPPKAC